MIDGLSPQSRAAKRPSNNPKTPPSNTVRALSTVAAAALSAGSLGAFAPPAGLARLVIARDNDPEGERAAERLARRCASARVAAVVIVPEGDDFNDDIVTLGATALRARLAPLFSVAGERGQQELA